MEIDEIEEINKEIIEIDEDLQLKNILINRLQTLYDNNALSKTDEMTILDIIQYLGGELQW